MYDTTGKSDISIFESVRSHVERNGRPNNYLVDEKELINTYNKFVEKENKEALQKREENNKKETEKRQ